MNRTAVIIVFCACGLGCLYGCNTEKELDSEETRYLLYEYKGFDGSSRLCLRCYEGVTTLFWSEWPPEPGSKDEETHISVDLPKETADEFWRELRRAGALELKNYGLPAEDNDYCEKYLMRIDGKSNRFTVYTSGVWDTEDYLASLPSRKKYDATFETLMKVRNFAWRMHFASELRKRLDVKEDRYISYSYDGSWGSSGLLRLWRQNGDTTLRWDNAGWDAGSWNSEDDPDWPPVHLTIAIPKERADKFWQQLQDLGVMEMKDVGQFQMEQTRYEFVVQIDGRTNRFILWPVYDDAWKDSEKDDDKPEEQASDVSFKSYKYDMLYKTMREMGDYAWEVHEASEDK